MKHLAALLAAFAMPATAVVPVKKAPVRKAAINWTGTFNRTADGNFVQGNPAAKVKLVAYLSLTCPHCAHFEGEAAAPLAANYIRSGKVSLEVRHAVRDPFDMTATLLGRCTGARGFFAAMPVLFATQPQWLAKAQAFVDAKPDLSKSTPTEAFTRYAQATGLDAFFKARGLDQKRMAACLANTPEADRLAAGAQAIWAMPGFSGTPAFAINGTMASGVGTWAELDRKLAEAAG